MERSVQVKRNKIAKVNTSSKGDELPGYMSEFRNLAGFCAL